MIAVVFSKGFGWIDDQFLVIEIAQSWVDGSDFYKWLPGMNGNNSPAGFSFFYPGLHYLLFKFLEFFGLTSPQGKMYIVRLLHALWSLIIVYYGYKIALKFGLGKDANRIGWLLALFWIFPFLSVRSLVEYVSIPFLIYATWLAIIYEKKNTSFIWVWIGVLFGLAFSIRYQTMLFTGGIGIYLLYRKKWISTMLLGTGVIAAIVLIQGCVDYLVWNRPFVQLEAYVSYNLTHAQEYTVGPWYHYILFLALALIPPVSLYIIFGTFRGAKKMLILFIPVIIFIVFHSWYPNKQERFISTILPFLFIMGVIGWSKMEAGMFNPQLIQKWIKRSWVFFWIINFIVLIPVSTMYSKRARVESMVYLSKYDGSPSFLVENSTKNVRPLLPLFYLERWIYPDAITQNDDFKDFVSKKNWASLNNQPDFVLFFQPDNLDSRLERLKTVLPNLVYESTIEPGSIDKLLHWLNPINDNQNIYIYRNQATIEEPVN